MTPDPNEEQRNQWLEACDALPIKSCGRLDMATWLVEPVTVGRVTSESVRYVYFDDGAEVVVLGTRCDEVAFCAAEYTRLRALTRELQAENERLRRHAEELQVALDEATGGSKE